MAKLEIYVERIDPPADHETVIETVRAHRPASPADAVRRGLALFNLSYPGEIDTPLNVFLCDRNTAEIHGGLLARTGRGALQITELWVAEPHRHHGHGSTLLARAELEAMARGCRLAHVESYSFHAPAFYERHGYRIFGRLSGFSGGHTCFYLCKDLESRLCVGAV